MKPLIPFSLLVCSWLLAGCSFSVDSGEDKSQGPALAPEEGEACVIQFRRDALGAGADLPVPPLTGSINGAEVSVTGKFLRMDDEWIVISHQVRKEEIWVPRDVVLLLRIY